MASLLEKTKIDYLPLSSEDRLRDIKARIKARFKRREDARNNSRRKTSRNTE